MKLGFAEAGSVKQEVTMITRREFIKYCMASSAALGLSPSVVGKLGEALAAGGEGLPSVIWLSGASCTGCTVSLANRFVPSGPVTDVADLLINYINLAFHPNLMAAAGDQAVQNLRNVASGDFILAVEGGVPTVFGGRTCTLWTENGRDVTAMEAVSELSSKALATLCIGTCASYGGMSAGDPNPTGVRSVGEVTGASTIHIAGCPPHPDWIVGTVATLLAGVTPRLDPIGRPGDYFDRDSFNIHEHCPRREREEAKTFGTPDLCLEELGCKGPHTWGDCFSRKWNDGSNWCIGANAQCIGCTEKGFPDAFSPFYGSGSDSDDLVITLAEWRSDSSELIVEGRGDDDGHRVMISDAHTGGSLGAATVDSFGQWRFSLTQDPAAVTRRVRAQSDEDVVERDVRNAPDGDGGPEPFLEITFASWNQDSSQLQVEGRCREGATVLVSDATTGALLGSCLGDGSGTWACTCQSPSPVPCQVRIDAEGLWQTKDVKNAAGVCGEEPDPGDSLVITRAEWSEKRSMLLVQGQGGVDSEVVTITVAGPDLLLGYTKVKRGGKWQFMLRRPSEIPCQVNASSVSSGEATAVVRNAPSGVCL